MSYRQSREPGVIRVFRIATPSTSKPRKSIILKGFQVITKRGSEPVYLKYDQLKKDFPNILFDFFEKRMNIVSLKDDCLTPERKERQEREKETTRDREESGKQHREKENRERQHREQRQKAIKDSEREEREKAILRIVRDKDSRPMRSCRARKDGFKHTDDFQFPLQPPRARPQSPSSSSESPQESSFNSQQQFKTKSQNKILDFDQMLQDMGQFNLISPAVIPASKTKQDLVSNLNPGTFYPPLPPIKDNEREYSSQIFKDSEQSEFLLDERALKEKKRRDRSARQLLQNYSRNRKRSKKIKKKKRSFGK